MGRMVVLCLVAVVSALLLLMMLVYASFPALAPWLIGREVARIGIETLDIELERPGLTGIRVPRVSAVIDGYALELDDVEVSWNPASLRRGRLTRMEASTASLTLLADLPGEKPVAVVGSAPAEGDLVADRKTPTDVSEWASLFDLLPIDAARVEVLSVFLPALDAVAHGNLDFTSEQLSLHLTGETPVQARGLVLDARFTRGGQVELALAPSGNDGTGAALNVRSSLPVDRLEMAVQARLSGFALDLVSGLAGLPAGSGLVTGRWQLGLPWPMAAAWRESLTGEGPIRVDWVSADGRVTLKDVEGHVTVAQGIMEADLSGRADVRLDESRMVMRPAHLRLVAAPLRVDVSGQVEIASGSVVLAGGGEATLSPGDPDGYAVAGRFDGELVTDEAFRAPLRGEGSASLNDEGAVARLSLSSGGLRNIPVDVRYDGRRQRTEVRVDHPISFSKPFFRGFWPGWKADYDLDGGTLEVAARLVSDRATGLTGSGTVDLVRVAAHVGPAAIRGLSGSLALTLDEAGPRLDSGRLTASLIDFGVPLSEVAVDLTGTPAVVQVQRAALKLLGGRASAAPFSYRVGEGTAETVVTVEDLELSRVLALEGEHITGTGRLDGTLPIRLSGGAFGITGGRISARPPGGAIRLQSAIARAITQPGLDLALSALTDFQFSLLETVVDYSDRGDLALGIRLEGRNPEVEKGRPIHFNLNVSENIPVLLQSLRLKDEFAERIERKVLR